MMSKKFEMNVEKLEEEAKISAAKQVGVKSMFPQCYSNVWIITCFFLNIYLRLQI